MGTKNVVAHSDGHYFARFRSFPGVRLGLGYCAVHLYPLLANQTPAVWAKQTAGVCEATHFSPIQVD